GGNRTVGPKQHEEFKIYEELFLERVRRVFPHVIWHHCGQNLKEAIQWIAEDAPGVEAAQFDSPVTQYKMSWSEWFEWAAKTFKGRRCAMNSPTTQLAMFGTSEQVKDFVGTFIRSTAKHTTAAVMPGCEIGGYTPPDNVTAMIAAAREYGRYPIKT
ncbi:MAG: uroporphyrinogen decarboxylase family protein, partial [Candidatus Bathyarchaeia archaeon]